MNLAFLGINSILVTVFYFCMYICEFLYDNTLLRNFAFVFIRSIGLLFIRCCFIDFSLLLFLFSVLLTYALITSFSSTGLRLFLLFIFKFLRQELRLLLNFYSRGVRIVYISFAILLQLCHTNFGVLHFNCHLFQSI